MPRREPRQIHSEHKMKDRIQNPPGMFGRAELCGFEGYNRQPDDRREPHPQDSLGGRSQLPILAMQRIRNRILLKVNECYGDFATVTPSCPSWKSEQFCTVWKRQMSDHGGDVVVQGSGHYPLRAVLEGPMSIYLIAFIVLMVAWIYGWIGFHAPGGLIHILPVFAVVLLILHFVRGRDREADLRITR